MCFLMLVCSVVRHTGYCSSLRVLGVLNPGQADYGLESSPQPRLRPEKHDTEPEEQRKQTVVTVVMNNGFGIPAALLLSFSVFGRKRMIWRIAR